LRRAVELALRSRALALRCVPRRSRPLLRTRMKQPSYPDGYEIETLGPMEAPARE
jgi:hypothetical protein